MKFMALVPDEVLGASVTETILQVVAAINHQVRLLAWGVSFAGTGVTDPPVRAELVRQTTAGTSAALTLVKWNNSDGDTIDATALQDFTAEPTLGDILMAERVHPQAGYELWFPVDAIPIIGAGDRLGVRVITGTAAPNVSAFMLCEE